MPYNTRRKSLSLPSLGIHLPSSSRRSPSSSSSNKISHPPADDHHHQQQLPPSKKVKRSHDSISLSPEPPSALKEHRPSVRRATWEHTPPPSPMADGVAPKIDTEGINDDIVVGVIEQLELTGNRPHLVKELAAVLVTVNDNVAKYVLFPYPPRNQFYYDQVANGMCSSANPAALLSSRLSTYMKRSWTALAPCPIAKELIPIHPRKVYYYLTTMPRQPLPENSDDLVFSDLEGKNITPSVSSVDQDEEEDLFARQRSPSPEVDLSSPDFEDEPVNLNGRHDGASRSTHSFGDASMRLMHSHRTASPPLEGDEKEFTQTASAVRERASEQKATQAGGGISAISEGLSELQDGSISISASPMDDDSLSSSISGDHVSDDEFGGYFSHDSSLDQESQGENQQEQQSNDDAAACALLGTSPSPSLTSVASSLPSSVASDAGLDAEDRGPQITLPEDPEVSHVAPVKRSIDMLNSGFPDVDIKMSDLAEHEDKVVVKAEPTVNDDVEMAFDSWRELQSPETVEVDELDEMFGEI